MPDICNDSLINKIALGTAQFGLDYGISNKLGQTPIQEIKQILDFASSQKINYLDTASAYGESEKNLGEINLQHFKVVSKFLPPHESNLSIAEQLSQSLKLLGVKQLHGYLAHRPFAMNNADWQMLLEMKNEGLIQKIGFSFSTLQEFEFCMKNQWIPDIIQAPFNVLDNRFFQAFQYLKNEFQTEIHVRSVFLQGLLLMPPTKVATYFSPITNYLYEIEEIFKPKAGGLLHFVLSKEIIDKVVIGVNTLQQLKENISQLSQIKDYSWETPSLTEEFINPSKWPGI